MSEAASPTPLSLRLYAGLAAAASPLAPVLLRRRASRGKEDPLRIGERLGQAGQTRPDGPLVWLHGASVGEALSLLPLIDALATTRPDLGLLVTSGTATSATLMAKRLPARAIHQYAPIDTPAAGAAFLDHWRPGLGVFVESELWPNLLLGAERRGVKLALLSAKMSDASYSRLAARFPRAARRLFGVFDLILAQDARAAERLTALGAAPAGIADLKFGAEPLPVDKATLLARRTELGDRRLVLAASTHPGEEDLLLSRWRILLASHGGCPLLVIAPRHPERGPAIAAAARTAGFDVGLQSAGGGLAGTVFIADALGELGLWFRLAHLTIMGGGFFPGVGGHNPLEPARLGAPFVSGLHVENWVAAYRELEATGAVRMLRHARRPGSYPDGNVGDDAGLKAAASRAPARPMSPKDAAARAAPWPNSDARPMKLATPPPVVSSRAPPF